jgi:hypothetical protein
LNGRLALLIRHFEEEQKRELLDIITIGETIIAKDVAVVPQLLNEWCRGTHRYKKI